MQRRTNTAHTNNTQHSLHAGTTTLQAVETDTQICISYVAVSAKKTSTSVLWLRNFSTCSESVTSHSFSRPADSQAEPADAAANAAGRRHGCHLKSMTSYQNPTPSINAHLLRTILPNFFSIRFEITDPWAFL